MGKDAPAAPDYTAAAQQQGASSLTNLQYQTNANRPNVNTPFGSSTWDKGTSFDQSGYDAAMAAYNATGNQGTWVPGTPAQYRGYSSTPGTDGHWEGATGPTGTAPDKKDFSKETWTNNVQLTPEQQSSLDSQNRVQLGKSQGAETLLGQAVNNFQSPMDWSGVPQGADRVSAPNQLGPAVQPSVLQKTLGGSSGDYRQRAQDAVDQLQQPNLDRQRSQLETQLANQGITRGSEAYTAAMRDQGDVENRAHLAAIDSGRQESAQSFGQDLSAGQFGNQANSVEFQQMLAAAQRGDANAQQLLQEKIAAGGFNNQNRQQAIGETTARRNQTLNELNALLTGQQVQNPTMPSFTPSGKAETTNYLGAAQNQYGASTDATNVSNANTQGLMSGLGSLASMFMFSDARLKRDVSHLFTLPNGIKVYKFRMLGDDRMQIGVLAQEVMEIMPLAVIKDKAGYYRVNYEMVLS